jgi:hypothetical protein
MKLDREAASIVPRTEATRKAVLVLEDGTVFRGRGLGAFLAPSRARGRAQRSAKGQIRVTRMQHRNRVSGARGSRQAGPIFDQFPAPPGGVGSAGRSRERRLRAREWYQPVTEDFEAPDR